MYMIRGFAMMSRDLREARDALANAADLYAKAGDHGPQGLAVQRLAGVACAQGDFALAEQIAEKARRLDLENGEDRLLAFLQQEHINLALARGENRMAAHLVDEILPTLRKSGQLVAALRMMTAKARALCRLGEVEEALDIALEVVRETHETPGAASFNTWVNYALSEIELARGNPSAAARCLADALADTLPNQQLRLASLLLHAGSAAAATDRLHEAVSLFGAGQTMRDRGGEAASRGADGERELRILELRERLGAQTFHQDWRRGAALVDAGSAVTFARNVLAAVRADVTQ
jgi:tetratricopeptide (TPR) repeat protein